MSLTPGTGHGEALFLSPGGVLKYIVQLESAMNLDPRTEFHRVIIRAGKDGLHASSTGGQRSSRVASLSGANGLVMLPMRTPNQTKLEVGASVEAVVIGEIQTM